MRLVIIGVICTIFFVSCSSDEAKIYSVGSDFIENDVQIRVIDTFSINTGTFKLDSLITSNTNRILVGSVIDEDLGHLTSQPYFRVSASSFSINSNAVYDSIGFIMNYDTYYYGDTTQVQTYKLHRITETVEPDEGTDFYNTSSLEYDSESIGELTFAPRPNTDTDSLYIPIDIDLGEEIFDKIINNDINTTDDFVQYFRGLTVIPDTTVDSHVLGFNFETTQGASNSSSMRLFYTVDDEDDEDNSYYIDFVISETAKQFNAIDVELSSTALGEFEDGEVIVESVETENKSFVQSGTGISSRIEIPSIRKLKELSEVGTTLSAELTFKPFDTNQTLKDSLAVYVIDHKNRILKQLTDIDSNISYAILNSNTDEFDNQAYYSIDLNGYVEEILHSTYTLNYALMIQFKDYDSTVDKMAIKNEVDNEVQLTVKYLNY